MLFSPTLQEKTYDISNIAMLMPSNANAKKYHNAGKGAIGLNNGRRRRRREGKSWFLELPPATTGS